MPTEPTAAQYKRALSDLLDALDRMYSEIPLSARVEEARSRARMLVKTPKKVDPRDVAQKRAAR